jgi:AAA ATPase domain
LQGIAEPNTVIIAESTRRLLGNLFDFEDLGAKELKGIAQPMRAWAALRASSVASRFEALHASGLTELVSREEELDLLLRRWSMAKSGEGQVVLLSGEAGIGKSRLTAALLEGIADEPHRRLRYFCSPPAPTTNAGGARFTSAGSGALQTGADDLRGCSLDRPEQHGVVQSGRGPDREPSGASDRQFSTRVKALLDGLAS